MPLCLRCTSLRGVLIIIDLYKSLMHHCMLHLQEGRLSTCKTKTRSAAAKIWDFKWLADAKCYEYVNEDNEVIEVRQNPVSLCRCLVLSLHACMICLSSYFTISVACIHVFFT